MGYVEKVHTFQMLFYMLHEDFRKIWGKVLQEIFIFFKVTEKAEISRLEKNNDKHQSDCD